MAAGSEQIGTSVLGTGLKNVQPSASGEVSHIVLR